MGLRDSPELRTLLLHFYPTLQIQEILRPSGQRVVYFCRFDPQDSTAQWDSGSARPSNQDWSQWGNVVLKVSADIHPIVIARLEKERQILDGLDSSYFPRLLYYDLLSMDPVTEEKLDHRLFVTIEERIDGLPLSECKPRFSAERSAVQLLQRLVAGLTLLWNHPQRFIHRDLKPDNILIRADGSPVIIDLGIVREQGSAGITATFLNAGPCTPAYGSPEQLRNDKLAIDHRADFFALGVVMYEVLTGENPFMRSPNDPWEIVAEKARTFHPPTLEQRGCAGQRLSKLVEALMAKERYQRPRTVDVLAAELEKVCREAAI